MTRVRFASIWMQASSARWMLIPFPVVDVRDKATLGMHRPHVVVHAVEPPRRVSGRSHDHAQTVDDLERKILGGQGDADLEDRVCVLVDHGRLDVSPCKHHTTQSLIQPGPTSMSTTVQDQQRVADTHLPGRQPCASMSVRPRRSVAKAGQPGRSSMTRCQFGESSLGARQPA